MLAHLSEEGQAQTTVAAAEGAEGGISEWPSFEGWIRMIRVKAELIAGYYRIEAFKEYLQRRSLSKEERWWVCSIYNKGVSPWARQAGNKLT